MAVQMVVRMDAWTVGCSVALWVAWKVGRMVNCWVAHWAEYLVALSVVNLGA